MPNKNVDRLTVASYGEGYFASGANPDFKVTSATRAAREMEALLRRLSMQSDLADRKLRALDKLSEAKAAATSEPDPVLIEPIDETKVEPVADPAEKTEAKK